MGNGLRKHRKYTFSGAVGEDCGVVFVYLILGMCEPGTVPLSQPWGPQWLLGAMGFGICFEFLCAGNQSCFSIYCSFESLDVRDYSLCWRLQLPSVKSSISELRSGSFLKSGYKEKKNLFCNFSAIMESLPLLIRQLCRQITRCHPLRWGRACHFP